MCNKQTDFDVKLQNSNVSLHLVDIDTIAISIQIPATTYRTYTIQI